MFELKDTKNKNKKKKNCINLFFNRLPVGSFQKLSGSRITFRYFSSFLEKGIDLISSMPPVDLEYGSSKTVPFLESFLPENENLKAELIKKYRLASGDIFGLLKIIGKDAGSCFIFLSSDEDEGRFFESARLTYLNNEDLYTLLSDLSQAYPQGNAFLEDENDYFEGISLGGMQEKTALFVEGDFVFKPSGYLPSTHIVKPTIKHEVEGYPFSDSVDNEWCCLFLFKKLGFKVADSFIKEVKSEDPDKAPIRTLFVKRFDRKWSSKNKTSIKVDFGNKSSLEMDEKTKIEDLVYKKFENRFLYRLPAEDIAQKFGFSASKKYEKDGGKTLSQIANLLSKSLNKDDKKSFLKSIIMMDLLCNTDAHNKNFSIMKKNDGFELTPFYDILSLHFLYLKYSAPKKVIRFFYNVGKISKTIPTLGVEPSKGKRKYTEISARHFRDTYLESGLTNDDFNHAVRELREKIENLRIDESELDPLLDRGTLDYILKGMNERAAVILREL